jgi:hypothetical protein
MTLKEFWYRHWRKITTVGLVLLTLAVVIPVLVFFPPALAFFAGLAPFAAPLLTMAAAEAIALVSVIAAATVFLATAFFHKLTDWLAPDKSLPMFGLDMGDHDANLVYSSTKVPRYGKKGAFVVSQGIGAIALIGTVLVAVLALNLAIASAPVWIPAVIAYGIGLVGSGILHAVGYGAIQYENYSRDKIAEIEEAKEAAAPAQYAPVSKKQEQGCFSRISNLLSRSPKADQMVQKQDKDERKASESRPDPSSFDADPVPNPEIPKPKLSTMGRVCMWLSTPCRGGAEADLPPPSPGSL